jgi:hypothetical protein
MSGLIAVSYVVYEEGWGLRNHQIKMFTDRFSAIEWLINLLWEEDSIDINTNQFSYNYAHNVNDIIRYVKNKKITLRYLVQRCNSKNIGDFKEDVGLYVEVKDESGLPDEEDYEGEGSDYDEDEE